MDPSSTSVQSGRTTTSAETTLDETNRLQPKACRQKRKRSTTTAGDAYRTSDPALKLKCNALVSDMLKAYPSGRFVLLDGADALTCRTLLRDGHDLSNSSVFNYHEATATAIMTKTHARVQVVVGELVAQLERWPTHLAFAGGWLDFCGAAHEAVRAMETLFRRNLICDDASFAITWCTRSGRGNAFVGEAHQQTSDAESQIAQIAERAGYALIKLPGASSYRSMHFWSFRLRKCVFMPNAPNTDTMHARLGERLRLAVAAEFVVEQLLERRWDVDQAKWMYRVQWEGYADTTWEPEEMLLEDCPEMVRSFTHPHLSSPPPPPPLEPENEHATDELKTACTNVVGIVKDVASHDGCFIMNQDAI